MKTEIKLLDDKAVVPKRAHETDTGYDITIIGVDKIIGDVIFFKTGIALSSPDGYYWEVTPCSRISKQGFSVANSFGVIDENYTGEIIIAIRVHHAHAGEGIKSSQQFATGLVEFEGKRYRNLSSLAQAIVTTKPVLTQLILRKRYSSEFEIVEDLKVTARGDGGFGSTDKSVTLSSARKKMLTKDGQEA